MGKLLPIFAVLFAAIILSGSSTTQHWSNEQKDVWVNGDFAYDYFLHSLDKNNQTDK